MRVDVINSIGKVIGSFEHKEAGQGGDAFTFVAMQPIRMAWLYEKGKLVAPENDAWAIESLPGWKPT